MVDCLHEMCQIFEAIKDLKDLRKGVKTGKKQFVRKMRSFAVMDIFKKIVIYAKDLIIFKNVPSL